MNKTLATAMRIGAAISSRQEVTAQNFLVSIKLLMLSEVTEIETSKSKGEATGVGRVPRWNRHCNPAFFSREFQLFFNV